MRKNNFQRAKEEFDSQNWKHMLIILFRLQINGEDSKMLGAGPRPLDKQVYAYLSIQKCWGIFASI